MIRRLLSLLCIEYEELTAVELLCWMAGRK